MGLTRMVCEDNHNSKVLHVMEPHGQSPWYLHHIPSYAKASEGYPPTAKSAEAAMLGRMK